MSKGNKTYNTYNDLFGLSSEIFNDDDNMSFLGIDMDSIYRAYNKKQKCPKDIINFKKEYYSLYKNFKNDLVNWVNMLHNANVIDMKLKYPTKIMNMKIDDNETKMYFNSSQLWNGEESYCDIKTDKFKARFLSNLYCELKLNLDNIIETQFRYKGRKILEYEDKYFILLDMIDTVNGFTKKFIEDEYTFDDFIKLNKIFCCKENVKKRKKVINKIKDVIPALLKASEFPFMKEENQYEFINDLINISYVISTESTDMKDIHRVPEKIVFDSYYAMQMILVNLGEDVYVKNIFNKSTPILYRAFYNANPLIWTKFHGTRYNKFLSQGIRSLYYLVFVTNDKNLYRFIKKMI